MVWGTASFLTAFMANLMLLQIGVQVLFALMLQWHNEVYWCMSVQRNEWHPVINGQPLYIHVTMFCTQAQFVVCHQILCICCICNVWWILTKPYLFIYSNIYALLIMWLLLWEINVVMRDMPWLIEYHLKMKGMEELYVKGAKNT